MSRDWTYGLELRREGDEVHAYCDDLPEAVASGQTDSDARREMEAALIAAVRGRIKDGMELSPPVHPMPHPGSVALPAWLAAKASLYGAWRASGLTLAGLAERIGRSEEEARAILDPDDLTDLDRLAEAAEALGGRLSIRFEAA